MFQVKGGDCTFEQIFCFVIKRVRTYIPSLIMLGLGFWVIAKAFGRAFWHPNEYPLAGTLDAWKNYFTPAWYIKYDGGLSFTGMNFPYGEQVLYTDNQPLVSWVLQWIHTHVIPIADHTVGILNMLIFLNIFLCMFLLYRIARHLSLPHLYAIPLSIILALLSPQIHRFAGHYALAYTAFIPLVWWLLIQYAQSNKPWLPFTGLIVVISLSGFIHAYYLLMGAMFSFFFLGIRSLSNRKKGVGSRTDLIMAFMALLIPVLVIQSFLWMTDPVADRPDNPSGILLYRAHWNSVFLPVQGPFWDAWQRFFVYERATVEGFSYVGLVGLWVFFMSLIRMGRYAWQQKFSRIWRPVLPDHLAPAVWAGILMLLFAMAIPLSWGLEFLLDVFPPIKQFRSLGRFAWVFYYVFTMYSAVYLYLIYRRLRQRRLKVFGLGILGAAMVMWGWEAAIHIKLHTEVIKANRGHNVFLHDSPDYEQWLQENGYAIRDFQAVLPIPVFNTGSEKFVPRWVTPGITEQVYKLAYQTGLPLACGSMSRTSVSQSSRLVQLLSSDYLEKTILKDYPDQRPLLILKEEEVPISYNEQLILQKARLIKREGRYSLFELKLSDLTFKKEEVESRYLSQKDSLLYNRGKIYTSKDVWVHWNGFDQKTTSEFGEETFKGNKSDLLILYEGPIPDTSWMHLSVWMKIDPHISGFPVFNFKEFDKNDVQLFHAEEGTMFGMNVFKNWLMVEYRFKMRERGNKAVIYMQHRYPEMESLLIRPEDVDVFVPQQGEYKLMYNNYYF